jgi:hypothetical protein
MMVNICYILKYIYDLFFMIIYLSFALQRILNGKSRADSSVGQKNLFHYIARNTEACKVADWSLCNTAYELEPATFALFPNLLPIGPLLENNQAGQFRREDSSCLNWLEQQSTRSVVYIPSVATQLWTLSNSKNWLLDLSSSIGLSFGWWIKETSTGPRMHFQMNLKELVRRLSIGHLKRRS